MIDMFAGHSTPNQPIVCALIVSVKKNLNIPISGKNAKSEKDKNPLKNTKIQKKSQNPEKKSEIRINNTKILRNNIKIQK